MDGPIVTILETLACKKCALLSKLTKAVNHSNIFEGLQRALHGHALLSSIVAASVFCLLIQFTPAGWS